jgi:hypothetical protein
MSRTYSPAKLSLAIWFSALTLAFGAQKMSAATVTYIVGTCTSGTHFSTISSCPRCFSGSRHGRGLSWAVR